MRAEFAAALTERVREYAPAAIADAWGLNGDVTVVVEQLEYKRPAQSHEDWRGVAAVAGRLTAYLHTESLDSLELAPLVAALMAKPLVISPDAATTPVGDVAWIVVADLRESRDSIQDGGAAHRLIFEVGGVLARRLPDEAIPTTAFVARAPAIGASNEDAYREPPQ